ncbi:MAG: NADH-quinone oxidoreductase subunit C [Phycisphaerales bacterium]|jgi:NADH-quinone oxidoreductase subunit C
MPATPKLDHPSLPILKEALPDARLRATEFRGQTTVLVDPSSLHDLMRHLREDPRQGYDLLVDLLGVDYLEYPAEMPGRFAVVYHLANTSTDLRLTVRTHLDPSIDTSGNAEDPALEVDSVTDLWPGAEWPEREVYDMFGIRFRNHPDLRRILLWKDYPGFPLRKDYPLTGRGERERYADLRDDPGHGNKPIE